MEFVGRIARVLPARSGKSERTGSEWKAQPFIFEYFENPSDRYSDKVLLETLDTNISNDIRENLTVRIGFGHHVREYNGRYFNEIRMYKFEVVNDGTQNTTTQQAGGQATNGGQQMYGGQQQMVMGGGQQQQAQGGGQQQQAQGVGQQAGGGQQQQQGHDDDLPF